MKQLTVYGHLQELKKRICHSALYYITFFLLCMLKSGPIIERIIADAADSGFTLVYISPQEVLVQSFRAAGILALILSLPPVLRELCVFVLPAIDEKKNRQILCLCMCAGFVLFLAGLAFCYICMFPYIYKYLYAYASSYGLEGYISLEKFISLFLSAAWVIGCAFELPLASYGLGRCGILTYSMMKKSLKPAIIIICILSAIVTPPDILSMLIVALPLTLVYLSGIGICHIAQRRRNSTRQNSTEHTRKENYEHQKI